MTWVSAREPFCLDPVEFGRGVMVSSAYRSPTLAVQVHVLRLRAAFERAGMVHRFRYVLNVLSLMREVQELAKGFWFPTPLRRVPVGDRALVVGPHPTAELRRHFSEPECAGYVRFTDLDRLEALPSQELRDWSGLDVSDTRSWTSSLPSQDKSNARFDQG